MNVSGLNRISVQDDPTFQRISWVLVKEPWAVEWAESRQVSQRLYEPQARKPTDGHARDSFPFFHLSRELERRSGESLRPGSASEIRRSVGCYC